MKRLAAITLVGLLAGCTGTELLPLQRDLQRFDAFVKEQSTGQRQTTAAVTEPAAPQDTATATAQPEVATAAADQPAPVVQQPAKPAPNLFERLRQNRAKGDATAAAPPPETTVAAVEPTPVAPQPAKPTPNLFERLRQNRAAQAGPVVPPGPHDQIPEPIPVDNPLVRPPWEVFMEAGPNANEELDLETLYGPGKIPPELQTADAAANPDQRVAVTTPDLPAEADQQAPDQPAPKQPAKAVKPGDVVIKAVAVPAVEGARGEGNAELTAAMRKALKEAGWPVLNAPRKDALTVRGRVEIGKAQGPNQSVKIVWDVLTPEGKRLGDLKQDNAVAAGSLDQSWGDNAQYAADAAAEGIFKLIQKYR